MLNPQNLDVKGAAEGVVSGAVENAIGAVMFSLSGATGAAVGSLRGVQAARDLMSGKRDDVQQVIKEVTETLGDEQACALLDSYAEQQKESQATAEELVSGKDEHGSLSAARARPGGRAAPRRESTGSRADDGSDGADHRGKADGD